MSSTDALTVRQLASRSVAQFARTDTPVVIRLRYTGTGSVTSVTVTTGTNIVTVTTEGTKTYAFATYTTVGAVADKINADGIFEAKVMDALRSDASTSTIVDGAITAGTDANGVTVWDATADTSALKAFTSAIKVDRDFNQYWKRKLHRVHLVQFDYNITLGGAGSNLVRVYVRSIGNVETQVYSATSVSATSTTVTVATNKDILTGNDGDDVIVRVQDGTSITDATANVLHVFGVLE